jgi:hypothetical protein
MRIALIADTHDALGKVLLTARRLRAEGVETVLHAGDVTGAEILRLLEDFDVWVTWGNMDTNPNLGAIAGSLFGLGRMDRVHYLTLEGKRIALLHGDDRRLLQRLIQSGEHDYVIHGHTHKPRDERVQGTRVINPGALGGPGWRTGSFALLDLGTGDLERIEL